VKCKMSASQGREEVFYIRWGEGIDNYRSILEIAIAHGIIKKAGSWITWDRSDGDSVKVQGVEKLRQHLVENSDHFEELQARVYPLLGAGAAEQFADEDDDEDENGIEALMAPNEEVSAIIDSL
jgi:recombination protein RecA